MDEFIGRIEQQSKFNIKECHTSMNLLYFELNYLNDLINRYLTKKSGRNLTHSKRKATINDIRDRIPEIYKHINFYKECINVEKLEMRRLYDTYWYFDDCVEDYDDNDELEVIKEYKYNFVNETYEEVN
jgi:hypothetical protein